MNNIAIFTICAKNYLAQALTLRESTLNRHNNIDFYIFLSDTVDEESLPQDLVLLNDEWVKNWKQMAFKYDVVEFSTAIKPYAIKKLFKDGYQKVLYIDPDIYVIKNLDCVFDQLDNYSAILTPHRCTMLRDGEFLDEQSILKNGIFNLGFFAVKNDETGNSIIEWWINKLAQLCYLDIWDGLAVDQKWMEFIPVYFPNDVQVSSHLGMNVAIWNLQERQLFVDDYGQYKIRNKYNPKESFDLLFWHFSGYSPLKKELLIKSDEMTNVANIPNLSLLVREYYNCLMKNGYDKYSEMRYGLNYFKNGDVVLPIHRRLYRHYEDDYSHQGDPFLDSGCFYQTLKKKRLLSKRNIVKKDPRRDKDSSGKLDSSISAAYRILTFVKKLIGIDNYIRMIKAFNKFGIIDNHFFLIS